MNPVRKLLEDARAANVRRRPQPEPELLAAAEANLQQASRAADGCVWGLCPFHGETVPSFRIFPAGWGKCYGCGVSEPASKWTRRAEVRSWAAPVAIVTRRSSVVPGGFLRAPRVAIWNASSFLLPNPDLAGVRRRQDGWGLLDPHGEPIVVSDLQALAERARDLVGPLGYRMFWACIALAEQADHAKRGNGQFPFTATRVGLMLGYRPGPDGKPDSRVRQRIGQAMRGLCRLWVRFRLSSRARDWLEGPLVSGQWRHGRRWRLMQLHPGVWSTLASGYACVPWNPVALQLRDTETLALYLNACWEWNDRGRELAGDLEALATKAGVWNAERASHDRGRYLATWSERIADLERLGLAVPTLADVGDGRRLVLAAPDSPSGASSRIKWCSDAGTAPNTPQLPPAYGALRGLRGVWESGHGPESAATACSRRSA